MALVNAHIDMQIARFGQDQQDAAGLGHGARFDLPAQHPGRHGAADEQAGESGLRDTDAGLRLGQARPRQGGLNALALMGLGVKLSRSQGAGGHIERAPGLVQALRRIKALADELLHAAMVALQRPPSRLRLQYGLVGHRSAQAFLLREPAGRLSLHRQRLRQRRSRFGIDQRQQHLPGHDLLAFAHADPIDRARHLGADLDARRRLQPASGHDRFNNRLARDRLDRHRRAAPPRRPGGRQQGQQQAHHDQTPGRRGPRMLPD